MNPLSLPKSSLLTKSWEYRRVYRKGKRLHSDSFSLIFVPGEGPGNRLGISIHGRLKGAVKRNRIKRIIREFYRLNRDFLPPPKDIVVTVRQGFDLQGLSDLLAAVTQLVAAYQEPVQDGADAAP